MEWSTEVFATNDFLEYKYIEASTPIGNIFIEWECCKVRKIYDVRMGNYNIDHVDNLEDAKQKALEYLQCKSKELINYLDQKK